MNSFVRGARRQFPAWLAALALVLLLLALKSVLNDSVQRGLTLRKAAATQADTLWRCNVLRGRQAQQQREQCLLQPSSAPN